MASRLFGAGAAATALAVWVGVMGAAEVSAGQAPAAPIDLSGTWALDVHLTDHPEQIARAIQIDTGTLPSELLVRGAGGRAAGQGRSGRAPEEGSGLRADDRKLLAELTRPVQYPPTSLTIDQEGEAVTFTAGERAPETVRADGRAEKLTFDAGTSERTARWSGLQLRVEYEVGRAGTLTYTYFLVPTGQLLVRVNFERLPGQPGPFEIKIVYNRKTGNTG